MILLDKCGITFLELTVLVAAGTGFGLAIDRTRRGEYEAVMAYIIIPCLGISELSSKEMLELEQWTRAITIRFLLVAYPRVTKWLAYQMPYRSVPYNNEFATL